MSARCDGMVMRAFLAYLVLEVTVLAVSLATVGLGWTLATLAGLFLAGIVLAAAQVKAQFTRLARTDPRTAVTDGALAGLGTVLIVVPGILTGAAGILLLVLPTRGLMRPLATALILRGVTRRFGGPAAARRTSYFHGDVIDGDVIDGEVIDGEVIDGEVIGDAVALIR